LRGRTQTNAGVEEMGSDELSCPLVFFLTSGIMLVPNIIGNEMTTENNQIEAILVLRCPVSAKFLRGFTMWFLRSMAIPARRENTVAPVARGKNSMALHSPWDSKRKSVIALKILTTAITVL